METRSVLLKVCGESVRVVSSADEEELNRLARVVSEKIAALDSKGRQPTQTFLLAALALAHELEAERGVRLALERRTRDVLRRLVLRLDQLIERRFD
jgi:cell division protein ZapA